MVVLGKNRTIYWTAFVAMHVINSNSLVSSWVRLELRITSSLSNGSCWSWVFISTLISDLSINYFDFCLMQTDVFDFLPERILLTSGIESCKISGSPGIFVRCGRICFARGLSRSIWCEATRKEIEVWTVSSWLSVNLLLFFNGRAEWISSLGISFWWLHMNIGSSICRATLHSSGCSHRCLLKAIDTILCTFWTVRLTVYLTSPLMLICHSLAQPQSVRTTHFWWLEARILIASSFIWIRAVQQTVWSV